MRDSLLGKEERVAPRELDVVRLDGPVSGWPAGSEGTVVEDFGSEGMIEFDDGVRSDLIVVPYSSVSVVWSARRELVR